MSTGAWREEKAEFVVMAICEVLASSETPPAIKDQLAGAALWNSLKLFADALNERQGTNRTKWSPGLVRLFIEDPLRCKEWLKHMAEPDFTAEKYWSQK